MDNQFAAHYARISGALSRAQFSETEAEIAAARSAGADATRLDYWAAVLTSRRGLHAQAEVALRALAARVPKNTAVAYELGVCLLLQTRHAEALAIFERLLLAKPGHALAWYQAGQALSGLARSAEAEFAWRKAIALAPERSESVLALSFALELRGRADQALSVLRARAVFGPDEQCDITSASLLMQTGNSDGARVALTQFLQHFPAHPVATHLLAGLGVGSAERASDGYVELVFDAFAKDYDALMQGPLQYTQHQRIAARLGELLAPPADVLELGCGTGLVGSVLAPQGYWVDGIDLSALMLDQASERGYRSLTKAEITQHVKQLSSCSYDVVLAADVLIYFGDLTALIADAYRVLRENGVLLFTVEAQATSDQQTSSANGFRLSSTGRYQHSHEHLQTGLAKAGFVDITIRAAEGRHEAGAPVAGWMVSARRSGS